MRLPSVLLLASSCLPALSLGAATITVDTFANGVDTDGHCSLHEALSAALTDSAQDTCSAGSGADDIVLQNAGTYTFSSGGFISGATTVTIRGNRAAGGATAFVIELGFLDRFLTLQNGAFVTLENLSVQHGAPHFEFGGCLVSRQASVTLRDTVFTACEAPRGGALYWNGNTGHQLVVERTTFQGNSARFLVGAGNQLFAGAVAVEANGTATARFSDVQFLDNQVDCLGPDCASAYGGAFHAFQFDTSGLTLSRVVFINNRLRFDAGEGGDGGAVMIQGGLGPTVVEDAYFSGNAIEGATLFGGSSGLHLETAGTSRIERVRLVGNDEGVALRFDGDFRVTGPGTLEVTNVLAARGGALGLNLDSQGSAALVVGNVTVTGHTTRGLQAFVPSATATLRIDNSIVWNNGSDPIETFGTPATIDPSNLIGVDPGFVNAAANDFDLTFTSPARDNGNGSLASVRRYDALHRVRIVGPALDRGAFERNALFSDNFESGDSGAWTLTVP